MATFLEMALTWIVVAWMVAGCAIGLVAAIWLASEMMGGIIDALLDWYARWRWGMR